MTCTFFGHRDTPDWVGEKLREVLVDLIENKNVDMFYVGNQGHFDFMVRKNLELLKEKYSHINYFVVLAYITGDNRGVSYKNSIYPEGMENGPPKYAIVKRNRWMIDGADYVVVYVKYNFGGAAQFKNIAEKKGKFVLNLAEKESVK